MPGVHEDIVGEETWMNTDEVSVTDPDPYFFLTQIQPAVPDETKGSPPNQYLNSAKFEFSPPIFEKSRFLSKKTAKLCIKCSFYRKLVSI